LPVNRPQLGAARQTELRLRPDSKLMEEVQMARKNAKKVVPGTRSREAAAQIEPKTHSAKVVPGAAVRPPTPPPTEPTDPSDPTELHLKGSAFVNRFLKAHPAAIALRSTEPAVCWGASGVVNFAAVGEFSGPNSMGDGAPLLFRIRVNLYPGPVLAKQLTSEAVRHKLHVGTRAQIATEPGLELTALPEEVEQFGAWVPAWHKALARHAARPPKPPIPLLSWAVNEDLSERREEFASLGSEWENQLYLWTPRAVQLFSRWLRSDPD
jgi:hypothetical protein